jgi:ATP-dependent RNA helicase RhlE
MSAFADLRLVEPLCRAVKKRGYSEATPIQRKVIPLALAGRDVLGVAQTGTGKTAAFALPILQKIARIRPVNPLPVRALVLAPTRELATQLGRSFASYGRFLDIRSYVLFGGVPEGPQITALAGGVDVLVATPGRLIDFHRRRLVALDSVDVWVLDEADRMLDLGFAKDIRQIRRHLPADRQTLFFSATMPPAIAKLSSQILRNPVTVEVDPPATPVAAVTQHVMYLSRLNKPALLAHLLTEHEVKRGLVFVRTKRGADRLATLLQRDGFAADAIHGDLTQARRTAVLDGFRAGSVAVLGATDVAARGLDVPGVSHVFNHELPRDPDTYVHRIGRSGRAGETGLAISLCDETEGGLLRDIERRIGRPLVPMFAQPWHSHDAIPAPSATGKETAGGRGKKGGRRRRR